MYSELLKANPATSHFCEYTQNLQEEEMSKLITVFGATGGQGGPIARALLENSFRVRAVTRNVDSDKAKALREAGAEVVAGNIHDPASVKAALDGAYGVYLITLPSPGEEKVGKAVGDQCKEAGLKHVVYSGLPSVKEKIGKSCMLFDSKAAVEKHLDRIRVPNTSVRFPFYFENFLNFYSFPPDASGTPALTLPMDGPMDSMSVADAAPIVVTVFKNPQQYIGKKVYSAQCQEKNNQRVPRNRVKSDWKNCQVQPTLV